ncbi:MAG: FAD-dependent monooxygenase [Bacteroidales bacterium]|nr:FAD-dependent monooxygenase [Bacteroidales bacterium]
MGTRDLTLPLPTDYTEGQLRNRIEKSLKIKNFTFRLHSKSLDARNKNNIHWLLTARITSPEIKNEAPALPPLLAIPFKKRSKKVLVVGNGPAGFFSAYVLQKAGFQTTIIEQGSDVDKRDAGINNFERTGTFDPISNYAFGEGGAGTFSDGKLTSRSKHISKERQFILQSYVDAGAPEEILYLNHPHIGSDNLKKVVKNLRNIFISLGGTIHFETKLEDLNIRQGKVNTAITSSGQIEADTFIIAPGHSAYDTYRMLIHRGVSFQTKNFALGYRIEHPQEIINQAQWGNKKLPGVKAAEYRLTYNNRNYLPVYTFCMCPGGKIVPSTSYKHTNIVNGMSLYARDDFYANAACVAGIHPDRLLQKKSSASEILGWLENLETGFYNYSGSYKAPFCSIQDFLTQKETSHPVNTSYPLGIVPAPLWSMLPKEISTSIREGLEDFSRKIKGFDTGIILGLESKTSSPIQVIRDDNGRCAGFENLYILGEGSGFAGGIISSAADGVRAALKIIDEN